MVREGLKRTSNMGTGSSTFSEVCGDGDARSVGLQNSVDKLSVAEINIFFLINSETFRTQYI